MKPKNPQNPEIKFYETDEFKKLDAKWQAKLEKTGFQDIETGAEPNKYLKRWDATWFTKRRHGWQGTTEQMVYFQECTRLLNERKFQNKLEKQIWELHTNGKTVQEIFECVNKLKRKHKIPRYRITKIVNEIKAELLLELKRDPSQRN